METRVVNPADWEDGLRELLETTRDDFIPPLHRERDVLEEGERLDAFTPSDMMDRVWKTVTGENRVVVAAIDGDRVVGALFAATHFVSEYQDTFPCDASTFILFIAVHPDHREQGVATAMTRTLSDEVASTVEEDYVMGRTQSTNTASKNYFTSLDFDLVTRIPSGVTAETKGEYEGDLLYFARKL